jgi:ornithine cyclodeaminase/alanine dehydrogenase-like protein (mu-crystallin family)
VTLILSDKDVRGLADMPVLVDSLEQGLRAEESGPGAIMPERMNLALDATMLRVMPAILPAAGVLGLKFFFGSLHEGIRYAVVVCAIDSGEVLAVIDAANLTALRTGATSGVATRHLARPDARTVGVIGSGLEAETNLAAVCAVRAVELVRVYSRDPARRSDFSRRMSERLGIAVEPAGTTEQAAAGADVVVVATNSGPGGQVAFRGSGLEPGQHVVSIGSTSTFLREIDEDALLRPDVVVFDTAPAQVGRESGDVIALLASRPDWAPHGVLGDVLSGRLARTGSEQVTLFKSVGTAAQDLIAGLALYQAATVRGVGLIVPDLAEPKTF